MDVTEYTNILQALSAAKARSAAWVSQPSAASDFAAGVSRRRRRGVLDRFLGALGSEDPRRRMSPPAAARFAVACCRRRLLAGTLSHRWPIVSTSGGWLMLARRGAPASPRPEQAAVVSGCSTARGDVTSRGVAKGVSGRASGEGGSRGCQRQEPPGQQWASFA